MDASHLIVQDGRGAFVDTGANAAVPLLLDALGQHHQHRRGAVGGQPVALVGLEVFAAVEDVHAGQLRLQLGQQRRLVDLGQLTVDAFVVEDIHGSRGSSLRSPRTASCGGLTHH